MSGRSGASVAGLATGFSLVCGWAFADGGTEGVVGAGHHGAYALVAVIAAAIVLLRLVSAEEKRLTSVARDTTRELV
jgi:hypothetical protein